MVALLVGYNFDVASLAIEPILAELEMVYDEVIRCVSF